ncbi:MAG TPA: ABC-2 family transporter protein [Ktedonobacterales bacterium]
MVIGGALSDLRLYWRLIGMQVRAQAQYKTSLAVDIGTFFFVTGLEFAVVFIVFSRFPTLLGWSLGEVALLFALASLSFGLAEMIGAGIDQFDQTIRRGEFDRVLLRPMSVFVQVLGSDFRLRRLGRLMQGVIAFVIALRLLPGLRWTALKLVMLPLGMVSGAAIFLAVLMLGATVCFWTVETTELTNIFTYGGREMLSWPLTIYNQAFQRVFLFIVPLAFGTYVPLCYVLGHPLPLGMPEGMAFTAPLAALLFALLTGAIWRFGVRHYQSTGS